MRWGLHRADPIHSGFLRRAESATRTLSRVVQNATPRWSPMPHTRYLNLERPHTLTARTESHLIAPQVDSRSFLSPCTGYRNLDRPHMQIAKAESDRIAPRVGSKSIIAACLPAWPRFFRNLELVRWIAGHPRSGRNQKPDDNLKARTGVRPIGPA
jgi:hypothetical protein